MFEAGRARGAPARVEPAHHAPRLLRHRHPAHDRAAGRQHERGGDARLHRRHQPGVPVGRRHLPRAGLRAARQRFSRSSPTTASPATTQPSSPTRTAPPTPASSRSCPRCARVLPTLDRPSVFREFCVRPRACPEGSAVSGTQGQGRVRSPWVPALRVMPKACFQHDAPAGMTRGGCPWPPWEPPQARGG